MKIHEHELSLKELVDVKFWPGPNVPAQYKASNESGG